MKSYRPAVAFGIALTAAAYGFGLATAHASTDFVNQGAGHVAGELRTAGYAVPVEQQLRGGQVRVNACDP